MSTKDHRERDGEEGLEKKIKPLVSDEDCYVMTSQWSRRQSRELPRKALRHPRIIRDTYEVERRRLMGLLERAKDDLGACMDSIKLLMRYAEKSEDAGADPEWAITGSKKVLDIVKQNRDDITNTLSK